MVKQCTKEHEQTTGVPVKKLVHLQSKILIHQSKIIRAAVDRINNGTGKMKITVYCMNQDGSIVCGIVTSDTTFAASYIERKTNRGLITIKRIVK